MAANRKSNLFPVFSQLHEPEPVKKPPKKPSPKPRGK
jgi:hypothetical protein